MTYSDVINSKLTDLSTTAGNAVSDLSGVVAGADVLASQFVDVKNALQDLQDFAVALRDNYAYTPTGVVVPFAGADTDTPPAGWFVCNGASFVSVGLSAGAKLYDLLTGAGWSALPDLRGKTIIGVQSGTYALKTDYGSSTQTLGVTNLPTHTHSLANHTHNYDHAHDATLTGSMSGSASVAIQGLLGRNNGTGGAYNTYVSASPQSTLSGSASVSGSVGGTTGTVSSKYGSANTGAPSTNTSGDGSGTFNATPVSVLQPSLALNYLIKG